MRGSIHLFKIAGISIKIHITFFLLPLIFGHNYGAKGIFLISFVFICVMLHELFHSLMAKRAGVRVREIVLLPIGGIASMDSQLKRPRDEFVVALAGPFFNLLVAAVFFMPMYLLLGPKVFFRPGLATWPATVAYAYWVNLMLAAFNLLPAFPMDGGRVFRALLALKLDYRRATSIAAAFGQAFALLFAFVGLLSTNIILILISIFIFMAAQGEEIDVDMRYALRHFYVRDILPSEYYTVGPETKVSEVLGIVLHTHQEDFPVVRGDKVLGLLTRRELIATIHKSEMTKEASEIMRTSFITASLNERLIDLHRRLEESGQKAAPVLRGHGGALCGIITFEDIAKVYSFMGKAG